MPHTPTNDTATDADLVAAHLAGDRSALATIYDRYATSLYDTAAAMTRSRHDAADVMQDVFVVAAERIGQLRDPARLKPWLLAILRNEVYRRSGRSRRTVSTDFTDSVAEMSLPSQPAVEAHDVEFEELAELVRAAAAGLDERDQLVLEYTVRQGLDGNDLADALGVSAQQCYGLVHRMRQRTERSLGALCVARTGRKNCPELADILGDWNGEFSVLVRKRVARHVDRCQTCERSRRTIAPFVLFRTAPALVLPPELRQRVLTAVDNASAEPGYGFASPGGFPTLIKYARRAAAWLAITILAFLIAVGATVYVLVNDGTDEFVSAAATDTTSVPATTATTAPPSTALPSGGSVPVAQQSPAASTSTDVTTTSTTTTPTTSPSTTLPALAPPVSVTTVATPTPTPTPATPTTTTTTTTTAPGMLTLGSASIDFGTATGSIPVTLSNTGGRSIDWSSMLGPLALRGAASPFSVSPASGTLPSGASTEVIVSFDRSLAQEGRLGPKALTFLAPGTQAQVSLIGTVARVPVFEKILVACVNAPPPAPAGTLAFQVSANVLDDTFPLSGVLVLTNALGDSVSVPVIQSYVPSVPNDPNDPAGTEATFNLDEPMRDPDGDGVSDPLMWSFTVIDGFGNSAELSGVLDLSQSCP